MMNIEEIGELLGLVPFDEFAKSKGYGRRCGRTTRAVCAAIAASSEGKDAIVAIHDREGVHYRSFVRNIVIAYSSRLYIKAPEVRSYSEILHMIRGRRPVVFGCDDAWWLEV